MVVFLLPFSTNLYWKIGDQDREEGGSGGRSSFLESETKRRSRRVELVSSLVTADLRPNISINVSDV